MYYRFRSTIAGSSFSASASDRDYINAPIEFLDIRSNYTYIGMNTIYSDIGYSGAGLCDLYCSSSTYDSAESAKSEEDNAAQHAAKQAEELGSRFRKFASHARQFAPQPRQ